MFDERVFTMPALHPERVFTMPALHPDGGPHGTG